MQSAAKRRVLILGGGFAGLNTASHLEKLLGNDVEITLVNQDNYSLFTPMLAEVAASGIEPSHIVNPIRAFLKRTHFREAIVDRIDLDNRRVETRHPSSHQPTSLEYDRLAIALGAVTNFRNVPGVMENALALKTMADAQEVRDHVLGVLEQAALVDEPAERACMLTFVIAGGGFSGAELTGALEDFVDRALRFYPTIARDEIRLVLVHPGPTLLSEVSEELGEYARRDLTKRGVDVRVNTKVTSATAHSVSLDSGETLTTHTLVWTAGTSPCPVLRDLPCQRDGRGAVLVDSGLEVADYPGVFALGDCAVVPDPRTGKPYPPTAQHAIRQAKTAAINVAASLGVGRSEAFVFDTLGSLAVLGHRTAVAEIKGRRFAGFPAWWMWRTVYLSKLPRLDRQIRVVVDWTLDLFFPADIVQLGMGRRRPQWENADSEGRASSAAASGDGSAGGEITVAGGVS
jgi:NADH dehydrogenase